MSVTLPVCAGHRHDHSADERRPFAAPRSHWRDAAASHSGDVRLAQLYDATLDGCQPCQDRLVGTVAWDANATADIVMWLYEVTAHTYENIPGSLLDNEALPGLLRELAGTYLAVEGGSAYADALEMCLSMTVDERRHAAAAALTAGIGLGHQSMTEVFSGLSTQRTESGQT
ncbi:hypothetical protein ACFVUW_11580 [Streptomyces xiamenensis]|uniref:hypothetical protein n=1 Tax=Streptomyces xiamenensis TaxID=408015 RepID=UPI0036F0A816